mmetsp:Transcript_55955/g.162180  ORF Transcript_55955/g.162180 Transcript_55955/m.162180 type:complete len:400 (-) Transcript_55955:7-1206(-)
MRGRADERGVRDALEGQRRPGFRLVERVGVVPDLAGVALEAEVWAAALEPFAGVPHPPEAGEVEVRRGVRVLGHVGEPEDRCKDPGLVDAMHGVEILKGVALHRRDSQLLGGARVRHPLAQGHRILPGKHRPLVARHSLRRDVVRLQAQPPARGVDAEVRLVRALPQRLADVSQGLQRQVLRADESELIDGIARGRLFGEGILQQLEHRGHQIVAPSAVRAGYNLSEVRQSARVHEVPAPRLIFAVDEEAVRLPRRPMEEGLPNLCVRDDVHAHHEHMHTRLVRRGPDNHLCELVLLASRAPVAEELLAGGPALERRPEVRERQGRDRDGREAQEDAAAVGARAGLLGRVDAGIAVAVKVLLGGELPGPIHASPVHCAVRSGPKHLGAPGAPWKSGRCA